MRWSVLGGVAFAISFSSFAYADGLPQRYVEPVYAPAFSWTGCYLGGHLGSGWGRKDWADDPSDFSVITNQIRQGQFTHRSLGSDEVLGVLAGGQLGCDYQVTTHLVIGAQADFSWAGLKGDHTSIDFSVVPLVNENINRFAADTKIDRLGTMTGRIGYGSQHALFYLKGGGAWVHDKHSMEYLLTAPNIGPVAISTTGEANTTRWGWTVGSGFEYAITKHISAFIEYDYLNFGSDAVRFSCKSSFVSACPSSIDPRITNPLLDIDQQIHQIKLGLNYRF